MDVREVKGDNYSIEYQPESAVISFQGSLRLGTYDPIVQLLNEAIAASPSTITLDLTELRFLNSSGISMLSKFVINMRQQETIQAVVLGTKSIPWQKKSLRNLKRLLPNLTLTIDGAEIEAPKVSHDSSSANTP